MVSYRSSDGKQSYHQVDELSDAMQFVEHLRNAEAVDGARIFKLEELSFEYRPYYRVELASALPPPPASAPADTEWLAASQEDKAEEPKASSDDEADPLAAAWSMTERSESPVEADSVGAGMGMGRKGLFGR